MPCGGRPHSAEEQWIGRHIVRSQRGDVNVLAAQVLERVVKVNGRSSCVDAANSCTAGASDNVIKYVGNLGQTRSGVHKANSVNVEHNGIVDDFGRHVHAAIHLDARALIRPDNIVLDSRGTARYTHVYENAGPVVK